MSNSPEYASWESMITRCHNEKSSNYKYYGARGITVYPEWKQSFVAFYLHVGRRPAGKTLDRLDNNGGYEPGNVRWATPMEQVLTRRKRSVALPNATIQSEQIDLLNRALALEANVNIRNAIVSVIDRIRLPMSTILARVPGVSAAARARALGISRQTYYAWMREENRPLTKAADLVAEYTDIPANLVSARSYLENLNDDDGRESSPPGARVDQHGPGVPRREGGVRGASGDGQRGGRRKAGAGGAARGGAKPGLAGSPGKVRRKPRRRPNLDGIGAGDV
jgi:hypothetical protein